MNFLTGTQIIRDLRNWPGSSACPLTQTIWMFSLDDSAGCQIGPNPCVLRNSSTAFGLWPRVYESEIAGHSSNVIIRELTGQFFVLVPLGSVCVGSLCHGTQAKRKKAKQRGRGHELLQRTVCLRLRRCLSVNHHGILFPVYYDTSDHWK